MKKKNGFTLIEVIFYIAMLSFLSFAVFSVLDIINREQINSYAFSEVNYQGLLVSRLISKEIKEAKSVVADEDSIIIKKNDGDDSLKIFFSGGEINVIRNNKLERLSNDKVVMSNLFFTDSSATDSQNCISFSFVISYNNGPDNSNYKYSRKFYGTASTRKEK